MDEKIWVHWYEHDCAVISKYCDQEHQRSRLVPLSYIRDPTEHDRQVAVAALRELGAATRSRADRVGGHWVDRWTDKRYPNVEVPNDQRTPEEREAAYWAGPGCEEDDRG